MKGKNASGMILVVGLLDIDSVILILWYPDQNDPIWKFFEIPGQKLQDQFDPGWEKKGLQNPDHSDPD